jgi:hypothetical protein
MWVGHAEVILFLSGGRSSTGPTFSATDTAVAPAPITEIITSVVETAGDYSTGASFPLLSNASWLEALSTLSDVARGAPCTNNDLNQSAATEKSMCKTRRGICIVTVRW